MCSVHDVLRLCEYAPLPLLTLSLSKNKCESRSSSSMLLWPGRSFRRRCCTTESNKHGRVGQLGEREAAETADDGPHRGARSVLGGARRPSTDSPALSTQNGATRYAGWVAR